MTSIRKKLLVSILSVVIGVTLLLAVATYFSLKQELTELYNENMKQVAISIAQVGIQDRTTSKEYESKRSTLTGEEEFLIQIWRGNRLIYTSHPAIDFKLQEQDGFGRIQFGKHKWGFFRVPHGQDIIQVAQDLHKRNHVIGEIYNVLLVPILIQLPALVALIWFLVGYGLRPLIRISDLIQKRNVHFLAPLPDHNVPLEILVLVQALNGLLTRLKSSLEVQRRFTADAAHELRTPLTAVRLQLDILNRADNIDEKRESLEALNRGVTRSIRLVEQLLELARQEPDTLDIPMTTVVLLDVIDQVFEQMSPIAARKHIQLAKKIDDITLTGNAMQLNTLIGNLVHNAILYTPEHGHVMMESGYVDDHPYLDVMDDGIGIAAKDQERIFDRFYRVTGTGTTGSGLGLSIVKQIAAMHKIDIQIRSGLGGKGTTFRLIFPQKS